MLFRPRYRAEHNDSTKTCQTPCARPDRPTKMQRFQKLKITAQVAAQLSFSRRWCFGKPTRLQPSGLQVVNATATPLLHPAHRKTRTFTTGFTFPHPASVGVLPANAAAHAKHFRRRNLVEEGARLASVDHKQYLRGGRNQKSRHESTALTPDVRRTV